MSVIALQHVAKSFSLHPDRARSFQELALNVFRRRQGKQTVEPFWALRDVTFAVEQG